MGDGVGFEEAGAGFVPLIGFDGDVFSDQGAGFGGGSASCFVLDPGRKEEAIDGGGRDGEEGLGGFWREGAEGLDIAWEPEG